jgi:tetratricopeptide (TPR) repeat protein
MTLPLLLLTLLQGPKLGTVHFPNSGAQAAQEPFIRGVAYLHSFEYDSAAKAFRDAIRRDSSFALAYWGEAMTHTHPVWNQQDLPKARAVLARAPQATTSRERAYLDAVRVLYGDGSKAARDTLYADAMRDLAAAYPDAEARAFYALALLGLNQGVRDVPTYLKAAAIVEEIFRANPDHPGAAHYLIHSYDAPAHAKLGLAAARAYSKIAPDAAHAQHMTTHIFLALGLWDDVVRQNEIASGPHREHWTAGHYTSWFGYGLLQLRRYDEARSHLEAMRTSLTSRSTPGSRAYLANMRAQYLINSERWNDPVHAWALDVSDLGIIARAVDAFGLGYAAVHRDDRTTARARLADLERFNAGPPATGPNVAPTLVPMILARELEAAILLQERPTNERALVLLREATALEDSLPVEYGPPDVVKPSHELLGEALLGLGRFREAQLEFERALQMGPGRARALLGLSWAQKSAGTGN